ncbi:hypothetical protein ACP4OV_001981 [Aristida adscensionis]
MPRVDGPRGSEGAPPASSGPMSAAEDAGDGLLPEFILWTMTAVNATGDAGLLSDPKPLEEEGGGAAALRASLGEAVPALAVGRIDTPRFAVPDVYHVPRLGRGQTLISVSYLARRGLVVAFGDSCSVRERSTGHVVGEGRMENGLYCLDYLKLPQS